MRSPDWSPAEIAYLDELVVRYGPGRQWAQVGRDMERRFGSRRPYRKMRLDLRHRELCRQESEGSLGELRSTALAALLCAGSENQVAMMTNPSLLKGQAREPLQSLESLANIAVNLPSEREVLEELMIVESAADPVPKSENSLIDIRSSIPCPDSAAAYSSATMTIPNHLYVPPPIDEFEITAQCIVDSHNLSYEESLMSIASLSSQIPPITAFSSQPTAPGLVSHPAAVRSLPRTSTKRRSCRKLWTVEENRHLRDLVALHGNDWCTVARQMQARFGERRPYTNRTVMIYYRRTRDLVSEMYGSSGDESEQCYPTTPGHRERTSPQMATVKEPCLKRARYLVPQSAFSLMRPEDMANTSPIVENNIQPQGFTVSVSDPIAPSYRELISNPNSNGDTSGTDRQLYYCHDDIPFMPKDYAIGHYDPGPGNISSSKQMFGPVVTSSVSGGEQTNNSHCPVSRRRVFKPVGSSSSSCVTHEDGDMSSKQYQNVVQSSTKVAHVDTSWPAGDQLIVSQPDENTDEPCLNLSGVAGSSFKMTCDTIERRQDHSAHHKYSLRESPLQARSAELNNAHECNPSEPVTESISSPESTSDGLIGRLGSSVRSKTGNCVIQ